MMGDVLSGAAQAASGVIKQAAGVADAARQTVANMSDEIVPVKIEIRRLSSAGAKKPRKKSTRKTGRTKKAQTKRAVKTTRKASSRTGKKAKKAGAKAKG